MKQLGNYYYELYYVSKFIKISAVTYNGYQQLQMVAAGKTLLDFELWEKISMTLNIMLNFVFHVIS